MSTVFYPKFQTSGHHTVYGILRATGIDGRPHAPKSEGAQALRPVRSRGGGWIELERAPRARAAGADGRRSATPTSAPRPPGRSRRGLEAPRGGASRQAGRDGAARGRLARESGGSDARFICGAQGGGRRLSDTWEQVPRAGVGEGCGRPTERDARDHALGRRRRKRPLADLAAQASGVSAHACCRARVIITAG